MVKEIKIDELLMKNVLFQDNVYEGTKIKQT